MCAGCQDKYAGMFADMHQAMRLSLIGRKGESFEIQGWRRVHKKKTAYRGENVVCVKAPTSGSDRFVRIIPRSRWPQERD